MKFGTFCAAAAAAATLAGCGSGGTSTTSGTAEQPAEATSATATQSGASAPTAHRRHHRRRPAPVSSTTTSATHSMSVTSSSSSSTTAAPSGPTPAIQKAVDQLLTVDTGAPPTSSDTQAVTADFVRLQGKCRETPEKLASEIWASDQDLHKNGRQGNAVSVTHDLVTVVGGLPAKATPTNCASLLAAYLVMREQ